MTEREAPVRLVVEVGFTPDPAAVRPAIAAALAGRPAGGPEGAVAAAVARAVAERDGRSPWR